MRFTYSFVKGSFHLAYVCLLALLSSLGCSGSSGEYAIVGTKGGNLLLRASPTLNGKVLTKIPNNSKVDFQYCCCKDRVNGRRGKWCRIEYKGHEGYAWGWYLLLNGERRSAFQKDCKCTDRYDNSGKVYQLATPSRRAEKIFKQLLRTYDIPKEGYAICGTKGLTTTLAYVRKLNRKKYVIYDRDYFDQVQDNFASIILAHELGHYVLNHSSSILAPRKQQELEADEFSGRSMFLLGFSLQESLEIMSDDNEGNDYYPSNAERRRAIETGWRKASGG